MNLNRTGHFKGFYHVYTVDGKRYIEEFSFELFEICVPSFYAHYHGPDMLEDYQDCGGAEEILHIEEIENNKDEEFYFEILGKLHINFSDNYNDYYGGTETDVEVYCTDYAIEYSTKEIADCVYSFYNPSPEADFND